MERYTVHLRYYAGDPLDAIRQEDLSEIGRSCGATITARKIDNRTWAEGLLREETLDRPIEEITQEVITVASDDEARLRNAILAIYAKYRSPRTPYGFWGSSRDGGKIARAIADETGGGW